ncbi:MAG: hypothetical protein H6729_17815 [Deltaproteobacteria bacterium]|nr:hypothetical protein [Deltaproteobacteria bacterium]
MELLIPAAVGVVFATAVVRAMMTRDRAMKAAWRAAAAQLEAEFHSGPAARTFFIKKDLPLGTLTIARHTRTLGRGKVVSSHATFIPKHSASVAVVQRTALNRLTAFGSEDIPLGDAETDRALFVQGRPSHVLAIFDAHTRRVLAENCAEGLRVEPKMIEIELSTEIEAPDLLCTAGRAVIDAAERMQLVDGTVFDRLRANILSDDLLSVRRRNFEVLIQDHPQAAEALAEHLVRSSDPSECPMDLAIRVLCARGRASLVCEHSTRLWTGPLGVLVATLGAFNKLGQPCSIPSDALEILLDANMNASTSSVSASNGNSTSTSTSVSTNAVNEDLDAHRTLVDALALQEPAVQDAIGQRLLSKARREDIKADVIKLLSVAGGPSAVEVLRAQTEGLLGHAATKKAARAAIAAIQARVEGGGIGSLSILDGRNDGGQGALSSVDEGGALSQVDDKA